MQIVARDPVSRRFMTVPGVGPVTALAFRTAVEDPARFAKSRTLGAYFGLTPKRYESGTSVDWDGRISRQGDDGVRTLLYEAASGLLVRSKAWFAQGLGLADSAEPRPQESGGRGGAKLAIILHAMWRDGSDFRFGQASTADNDNVETAPATA